MSKNSKILDVISCPICKGKLEYNKRSDELICKFHNLAFPIKDGVPIMLVEKARRTTEKIDYLMKEVYFSKNSIDYQAKVFQERIKKFFNLRKFIIDPDKAVLLVMDLQKYFLDESSHAFIPSANAIIPNVIKLQKYCLQNGIKVIQTYHANNKDDVGMMSKWWFNHFSEKNNSDTNDIVEEVYDPRAVILRKSQYDAFHDTELGDILKRENKTQLIIAGVMTNLCCESTARAAFTKGYEVFFGIDVTAAYNREFHMGTLMSAAYGFATPMLTDDILEQLTRMLHYKKIAEK